VFKLVLWLVKIVHYDPSYDFLGVSLDPSFVLELGVWHWSFESVLPVLLRVDFLDQFPHLLLVPYGRCSH